MSSIVQGFQRRASLPVSQQQNEDQGMRLRLSSMSLRGKPVAATWTFQRSKSLSSMGEQAGNSIRSWWGWGCSWILSRKAGFAFAQDLEMNEDDVVALGGAHNKGSWGHIFYKVRSEFRKLIRSQDKVGLPQTCRYDSYNYSKNFDPK